MKHNHHAGDGSYFLYDLFNNMPCERCCDTCRKQVDPAGKLQTRAEKFGNTAEIPARYSHLNSFCKIFQSQLVLIRNMIMQAIKIEKETSVLGLEQGYLGLSIRLCYVDATPTGATVQTAQILQPAMISKWLPTPDELALLNSGHAVYLHVLGTTHPPVSMTVGLTLEHVQNSTDAN